MSDETLRNAAADGAANLLETRFYAIHNVGVEVSTTRLAPTYNAASVSSAALGATLSFTGTGSQAVSHLAVYAAVTGGTALFEVALSGDLAFNAAGALNLTAAPVTVS